MKVFNTVDNVAQVLKHPVDKLKLKGLMVSLLFFVFGCVAWLINDAWNALLAIVATIVVTVYYFIRIRFKRRQNTKLLKLEPLLQISESAIFHGSILIPWKAVTKVKIPVEEATHNSTHAQTYKSVPKIKIFFLFEEVLNNAGILENFEEVSDWVSRSENSGLCVFVFNLEVLENNDEFLEMLSELSERFGFVLDVDSYNSI